MTAAIPDILSRIVARKREEVASRLHLLPRFEAAALDARAQRRDFAAALRIRRPAIVAEIKQASPSKGLLTSDFDPELIAREYERGGAAALSVLTDQDFFQGNLSHLQSARAATHLPVLRKDFTIDRLQIVEAAANGADAILLIAAILTTTELRDFRELAESYGMAAIVEVHDAGELDSALKAGARIIGVNNRDLRTFEVHLDTSLTLGAKIPEGVLSISESGIHSRADIERLPAFGAFLVGEHLMKSGDAARALEALRS